MAERPIFTPSPNGPSLVWTHQVEFKWFSGMSIKQVQKSIASLHEAAQQQLKVDRVLEISSKSLDSIGVKLSAFNLMITSPKRQFSVECAYQGSKVFERGGPFLDLLEATSLEAKRDLRLKEHGQLKGFRFYNTDWKLEPRTAFYDWLYINALHKHPELAEEVLKYRAFSDIVFNPERSVNCQAYSAALYVALHERNLLDPEVLRDQKAYLEVIKGLPVISATENTAQQPALSFESRDDEVEQPAQPEASIPVASKPASSDLKETFLAFREQCEWIQTCFDTNRELFGSGEERLQLLRRTASGFFLELNQILIENLIVQICKITDPATTFGRKNLTVDHINDLLREEGFLTQPMEEAARGMNRYRKIIVNGRNKLIAHYDKETVLSFLSLGPHYKQDVDDFFENMHLYLDVIADVINVEPLDFHFTNGPGDVLDLLKAINNGVYPQGDHEPTP